MHKRKTILRYTLFQIPELVLIIIISILIQHFYDYPNWIILLIIGASILKDFLMFNKTWRAYAVHTSEEFSNVIGKTGLAMKDIKDHGYININGELWKVEVNSPVNKGDSLLVKEINGLKLKVKKEN